MTNTVNNVNESIFSTAAVVILAIYAVVTLVAIVVIARSLAKRHAYKELKAKQAETPVPVRSEEERVRWGQGELMTLIELGEDTAEEKTEVAADAAKASAES